MSCEVKSVAKIPELEKVQELFGFSQDKTWLNAVYYSVSPTGETVAFGHGSKLVILGLHYSQTGSSSRDGHNQEVEAATYQITWKRDLENSNEIITSILCLPIFGANTGSGAEWTCIAVGLSSGLVLFYADSGVQIFSQMWHPEPVQFLKAQSGKHIKDEVYVGYTSAICILKGIHLFPTLKGLKQKISKALSFSESSRAKQVDFQETVQCRKWEYRSRNAIINDAVVVGPQQSCAYDHLLSQSLENGFYAKTSSTPIQHSLILGVGVKPYVGFHFAEEGYVQAVMKDVAKAVASQVLTSLSGFFRGSSSNTPQTAEQVQQVPLGEPLSCRFGVCDIQRQALQVFLAPENQLAAVTDTLGRVVLVDCQRGIALRIWKGYRDAQCSFIRVAEKISKEDKSTRRRKCNFLVIYAPLRATLEIWALQRGPKVAAFSVSKYGQLIYNTHSLMDIPPGAKAKYFTNMCLFFDPSDLTVKDVIVPFHCSLSDSNSKTAKDVHLLRQIKLCLRNQGKTEEILQDIRESCLNIQTNEIKVQCLEMLVKNKRTTPEIFQIVLGVFQEQQAITSTKETDLTYGDDEALKSLPVLLENYQRLVEFFLKICEPNLEELRTEEGHEAENDEDEIKLSLSESDLETIQKLVDLSTEDNSKNGRLLVGTGNRVTFQEDAKSQNEKFIEFLNVFDVESTEILLKVKKTKNFANIGAILFATFLEKGRSSKMLAEYLKDSGICADQFMMLLLHYWLPRKFEYTKSEEIIEDMRRLASIIQQICDLAGDKVDFEYNAICPWWQSVREILLDSPSALRGLVCAIVCRYVSARPRKRKDSVEEAIIAEENEIWEQVSQEIAQWSLLIGKLDDISMLGAILSKPLLSSEPLLPSLPYDKPDCSLKEILTGGKGIVAEIVSKWLSHSGIDPMKLIEIVPKEVEQTATQNEDITTTKEHKTDQVMKNLSVLRQHFPFSLESGILLCHLVWEYMGHWSKNLPNLQYLKAALQCLQAFKSDDLALKHGLCCMIWNAHFKIPLEATKKLINKAGRLPKEKFCQQDIGISDSLVADFLEHALDFFQHFKTSLEYGKRELRFEESLQDGPVPLSQLILQQNHAITEILETHIQLCKVLHLIAFFTLKIPKPMQYLFDAMANQTFFAEINRELSYVMPAPDLMLHKHRQEFLCQAVTASMDLIREDLERLYVLEHVSYMEKIESLADLWKLNKNIIKKHQIVEMYAHGWDAYAEELLESVVDNYDIGPLLLEIAGRRLNILGQSSFGVYARITSAGTMLSNYLDNLKSETDGIEIHSTLEDIHLEHVASLTGRALHCLSKKDSSKLRIAGQMLNACESLRESLLLPK